VEPLDAIDVVVELGLAAAAIVLAAVLFLRSRADNTVTVRGRTLRHTGLWVSALLLLGVVLVLRVGIEIVPAGWQGGTIAVTVLATVALERTRILSLRQRLQRHFRADAASAASRW
jgi:hypothetical protein